MLGWLRAVALGAGCSRRSGQHRGEFSAGKRERWCRGQGGPEKKTSIAPPIGNLIGKVTGNAMWMMVTMQATQSPLTCTVTEMARLLGISRSKAYACVRTGVIPAIHIGRRVVVPRRVVDELLRPAIPMVGRRAVHRTDFPPAPTAARILETMSVSRADDTLIRRVQQCREEILAAARRRGAHNVRLFGSLARGDAHTGSDVDFLVDFEPGRSLLDVSGLILDLEELLGVRVDVVEASALRSRDAHVLDDAVSL
jgi:uncharacterized protein